jgi:hypothetical protein
MPISGWFIAWLGSQSHFRFIVLKRRMPRAWAFSCSRSETRCAARSRANRLNWRPAVAWPVGRRGDRVAHQGGSSDCGARASLRDLRRVQNYLARVELSHAMQVDTAIRTGPLPRSPVSDQAPPSPSWRGFLLLFWARRSGNNSGSVVNDGSRIA